MSTYLEQFKNAHRELLELHSATPDLTLSLNHRLRAFFPRLPEKAHTDLLYLTHEQPPLPGQAPVIVSQTLSAMIEECYLTGQVPTFEQGSIHIYNQALTLDERHRTRGITPHELERYLDYATKYLERCVIDALKDFWETPQADFDGLTAKNKLDQIFLDLLVAESHLRHQDKTLSKAALDAIIQVFDPPITLPPTPPQDTLGLYSVALKSDQQQIGTPLNGVFIISDADLPGIHPPRRAAGMDHASDEKSADDPTARTVVLFTPANGLETFESLKDLTQELKARLRDVHQREALLDCVLAQDRARALTQGVVEYRTITQNTGTFYSQDLIHKQHHDMRHAWAEARTNKADLSLEQLFECVKHSLHSSLPLKPERILRARQTRLIEAQLPSWLKNASDADKVQWRLAVERLNFERLASESSQAQSITESGKKNTLLGYARLQLKQTIKADHNIEVDPDTIIISTTEALQTGAVVNPFGGSAFAAGFSTDRTGPSITYKNTRHRLTALALLNVGQLDTTFSLTAQVLDANGNTHPILTHSYIKNLVRKIDVGERYKTKLNNLLVRSPHAHWRKERYVALKTAQLKLDLIEAQLSGTLNNEQAAWVRTAMEHPVDSTRPLFNGAKIKVHLPMLRYKPLPGLLAFSSTGSSGLVCYLPDAPDRNWFVVATSRNELARKLSSQVLRPYLLNRVTASQRPYIQTLLNDGLTDTDLRFQIVEHQQFYEASYDTEAMYAIREADEQSTSTYESNLNTAKETILTAIDVVSFVLPTKVLLPIVMLRFAYQIGLGLDALARGEEHEAFLNFIESIAHLTDGASDFAGSAVFGRAIRQRARLPAPALNPNAATPPPSSGLTLRTGEEYGTGVYELTRVSDGRTQSTHYLKDSRNNYYRCQYDSLDTTWRVIDTREPSAFYRQPVSQLSSGDWDLNQTLAAIRQRIAIEEVIESAQVSGINLAGKTPDEQGIYRLSNMRYIEQSGLVFEVRSGWLGRDWYLHIPGGSSHTTSYKVRRVSDHWEIKHRLSPTTKRWELLVRQGVQLPPAPAVVLHTPHDVALEYNTDVQNLLTHSRKLLINGVTSSDPKLHDAATFFKRHRANLLADAQAFLNTSPTKPRPLKPDLAANEKASVIFDRLYENTQGVIIGEAHASQSGKKILIEQMAHLARNKVDTLFLEHLQTDAHQSYLDDFSARKKIPAGLDKFLKEQDAGHGVDTASAHNYSNLVRCAVQHGIKIKALDCMASYHLNGLAQGHQPRVRYEMFSYTASQIIRAHTTQNPGQKWIALVGNSHANTFVGVPGLAELEGAIGLRVLDAPPGSSPTLKKDFSEVIAPQYPKTDYFYLKNDYVMEMEIPGTTPQKAPLSPAQIEQKLSQPGLYIVENNPVDGAQLIHRSNNNQIIRTRLKADAHGELFIERPNWQGIHLVRYKDMNELTIALYEYGLRQLK